MQKPSAILFDLDGTLVDSVSDLADAVNLALSDFGLPVRNIEQIRSWIGNGAEKLLVRAICGIEIVDTTRSELQFLEFDELYTAFKKYYSKRVFESSQLYPGVRETLQSLGDHDIRLAVVTNKPVLLAEKLLTEAGLRSFFSVVVGGDSLAVKSQTQVR